MTDAATCTGASGKTTGSTGARVLLQRRHDVDWLRVMGTLVTFLLHAAQFFDTSVWELQHVDPCPFVEVLRDSLVWAWVMQLFFLLSGVSAWYALQARKAGQFLWERVKRLLVPLFTVGLWFLLPPQYYFWLAAGEGYTGTFWEAMRGYAGGLGRFSLAWPGGLLPVPFVGQLWFLQYLFVISLVTLPLLLVGRSERGRRLIGRLAGLCDSRGGVFVFLLPLILALIAVRGLSSRRLTWATLLYYAIFYLIGCLIPADERFTKSLVRHRRVCLALWALALGGLGVFTMGLGYDMWNEPYTARYVLFQVIVGVANWSAAVCTLSLGARYLNVPHRRLAEMNEAVLPFYLLHLTILVCVRRFVTRWGLGAVPKYAIIVALSFPLILLSYALLVRPFEPVRFLFGMRPRRKRPAS